MPMFCHSLASQLLVGTYSYPKKEKSSSTQVLDNQLLVSLLTKCWLPLTNYLPKHVRKGQPCG